MERIRLIGRSSSHFSRLARIFAAELGIDYSFEPVYDLLSSSSADYGGNPALRLPILETASGTWYGTLSICRELARQANRAHALVWPEDLQTPLLANAQELVLQSMATEVTLVMAQIAREEVEGPHRTKLQHGLLNTLSWLEQHVPQVMSELPAPRELSFLEASLFCLITHLEFRAVLSVADYPGLVGFCEQFEQRASARDTVYRFDRR